MKKFIPLFYSLLAVLFVACNKDEIHNTEDQVGISRVTHFAVLQMSGPAYMSIVKGSTFTDPGVKAYEGSNEIPVTITGSVNTDETGLYVLTYSATNKDGFPATATRTVVVIAGQRNAAALICLVSMIMLVHPRIRRLLPKSQKEHTPLTMPGAAPLLFLSCLSLLMERQFRYPINRQLLAKRPARGPITEVQVSWSTRSASRAQGISNSNRNWQRQ